MQKGTFASAPRPGADNREVAELAHAKFPELMARLGYGC